MLPLRLQMRNFMPYREPETLYFEGIHLACLTGHNGAGKSSILDAMTWALWGRARARRDDDLIHTGQQEMLVQFDFEQEGVVYRVVRQRARKGLRSELVLYSLDKHSKPLNNLSEPSIRATEQAIVRLLRMDYETFVNSAFLQQGKADAFTVKTPSQRKQLLSEMLGLEQWAQYEEQAKTKLDEIKQEQNIIEGSIRTINAELAREGVLQADLAQADGLYQQMADALQAAEVRLEAVAAAPRDLQAAQEQRADYLRTLRDLTKDLSNVASEIAQRQARIGEYQADLTERADIERGYEALQAARVADQALGDKLRALHELDQQRHALETAIAEARAALENDFSVQNNTLDTLEREAAQANVSELNRVQEEAQALNDLAEQREQWQTAATEHNSTIAALTSQNDAIQSAAVEQKERVTALQGVEDALCPLCGQPLTADHRDQLLQELDADVTHKRTQYGDNKKLIEQYKKALKDLRAQMQQADGALKRRNQLNIQAGALQSQFEKARAAEARLDDLRDHAAALRTQIDQQDYAHDARAMLTDLNSQRAALGYSDDIHNTARAQIDLYRDYERRYQSLQTALTALPDVLNALEGSLKRQEVLTQALDTENAKVDAVAQRIEHLQELAGEHQQRLLEANNARTAEKRALERRINAEQALQALARQRERRAEYQQRRAALNDAQAVYDELREAFGKNGIPTMIIEAAIPELEQTANELLASMTDGRMHLQLKTQREKVTGGVAETLEIEISDELGTRSYEMYSGGEAFRINFALRVALSQVLAGRAGAHLRTLFIDEGFGTQDEDGRNKLVEAINAVQDKFAMILIITHMEDLRDAFPVHVIVHKTNHGSRITVR
jgi:DNA repair protein SbcC/Rad50